MGIGENIKKFRLAYNMEQKELADKLHVSSKTVSSWECGRTEPKMGMIEDLAVVFGVSKTDIIEGIVYQGFDTSEEFRKTWHNLGGGGALELTSEERGIIIHYRAADEIDKRSVLRILGLETKKESDLHA